jgi:hypothetical protein
MAEINLWLDAYNDIYSDFDSRHYLKRRISEDFLSELRTEMKYKEQHTADMILLLPANQRNETSEKIIAESLVAFFTRQFHFYRNKCRKKLNKGTLLFVTGIILMLFNSWLSLSPAKSFLHISLKVLLEPAGWFLLWAALDFLYYDYTELKRESIFFNELSQMHVHFKSS